LHVHMHAYCPVATNCFLVVFNQCCEQEVNRGVLVQSISRTHFNCTTTKEEAHPVKSNGWSIILLDRPGQKNQDRRPNPNRPNTNRQKICPRFFWLSCARNRTLYQVLSLFVQATDMNRPSAPDGQTISPASYISARSFTGTLEDSDSLVRLTLSRRHTDSLSSRHQQSKAQAQLPPTSHCHRSTQALNTPSGCCALALHMQASTTSGKSRCCAARTGRKE
jgi:hypothetical protein